MTRKTTVRALHSSTFELPALVTIAQSAELHREFMQRAAAGDALILDGAKVEQIDTAILQLLVSTWRAFTHRKVAISWRAASDNLRRSAQLIGVAPMLDFPGV